MKSLQHAILVALVPGFVAPLVSPRACAEDALRPNIIFIMCDDLGYGDLGCYGQEVIETPHLDQLAAEGLRFTDFYSGSTVCRPSRLVLWSGLHSGNTPISANDRYVLPAGSVTVPKLLQSVGYSTGGVGKWSLGNRGTTGHPCQQGFDFWYGYLNQGEAHNYYPEQLYRNQQAVPLEGNQVGQQRRVSIRRTTYSHDLMTDEALGFIRRSAKRDQPFLLHIHWTIPHANNEGGRATGNGMEVPDYGIYKDRDWPDPEKGQAAMITRMDRDVGRLVRLLRDVGIERRTLVLFTSDNGPHNEGNHDHTFFDANGPLRGFKRDLYEGGIRVPLIAWWPGKIAAGSVSRHAAAFWDYLPTACELSGVAPPAKTDGISLLPSLLGQPQRAHEFLYWKYREKEAARSGDWKAVRPGKDKPLELYDLARDLPESQNVAAQYPDQLKKMQQILARGR